MAKPLGLRWIAFVLLSFFSVLLGAQHDKYRYQLTLDDTAKSIYGNLTISVYNDADAAMDTAFLHLPPRSLEWKNSFLQQQLLEFQNPKLYFASPEERGFIQIENLQVNELRLQPCTECEFVKIPFSPALAPGDSARIQMSFSIHLPSYTWVGSGVEDVEENEYRLVDWLPRLAPHDSRGFHLYPVTWQRDVYPLPNEYEVDLELPANYTVASNAQLMTTHEIHRLDSLQDDPYKLRPRPTGTKLLHYRHTGSPLNFFVAHYRVFPLPDGGRLFTLVDNPAITLFFHEAVGPVNAFLERELGLSAEEPRDIVLMDRVYSEAQSDKLLSIELPKSKILSLVKPKHDFDLKQNLVQARAESWLRYSLAPDGFEHVWLARGIPYYYKYLYIKTQFPQEKWIPFSTTFLGRIFSLQDFDYGYQNQFLYLFLARQGLDQEMSTPADSLTRLNYEAVGQAKVYLAFNHFRSYAGEKNFVRSMHRYINTADTAGASPQLLQRSFNYYLNRDTDWFFDIWLHSSGKYNYKLSDVEYCPTISTVTVKNKGHLALPFSVTGFKDGAPVLTQWYPGHKGKITRQMYHEDYDKVVLNWGGRNAEFDLSNNTWYNRWVFKRLEPIKLQFYNTFENPEQSQLFWLPSASYNAYDKLLLGVSLYNSFLIPKRVEWTFTPVYSTGQNRLTGSADIEHNIIPKPGGPFHNIKAGIYGRFFHFDENQAYLRISPSVTFNFRKPYPRSTSIQSLRLRAVMLDRELDNNLEDRSHDNASASYTILNLTYKFEETHLLRPWSIISDIRAGEHFATLSLNADLRWMLPNRKWLIWRNFGGYFFYSTLAGKHEQSYYSMGLSGTQDYMFDYFFIGRSDATGIWSRQFFTTEGGFKSETNLFANHFMLASNLSIPVYSVAGVYADIGWADNFNTTYYDYGVRLSFLTDFMELYLPVGNWQGLRVNDHHYLSKLRFVLNLDIGGALSRLRRGFY